jgi:hypothetical protein
MQAMRRGEFNAKTLTREGFLTAKQTKHAKIKSGPDASGPQSRTGRTF